MIGDGLSVTAVSSQVPPLLPLLAEKAQLRGWTLGQPFAVQYCRVGVMNDVGELLQPKVVVLLIGERPGLATAESLSAYMAYKPRDGPQRFQPQPDLKHSYVGRERRSRGVAHHRSGRTDDATANQRSGNQRRAAKGKMAQVKTFGN